MIIARTLEKKLIWKNAFQTVGSWFSTKARDQKWHNQIKKIDTTASGGFALIKINTRICFGTFFKEKINGPFSSSQLHGLVKISCLRGVVYRVNYSNGVLHGLISTTNNDGTFCKSTFKQGVFQGVGQIFYGSGIRYKGGLKLNSIDMQPEGKGVLVAQSGKAYRVEFKNGKLVPQT